MCETSDKMHMLDKVKIDAILFENVSSILSFIFFCNKLILVTLLFEQVFSMLLCCFSVVELIYALTEDNVPTVDYVAPLIMVLTYVSTTSS